MRGVLALRGEVHLSERDLLAVDELRARRRRGTALDPQVISGLLADPNEARRLDSLSPRERSVLVLVAEGRSNKAIAERLVITQGAVQKHVSTIFNKLGLPAGENDDRRILAVLAYVLPELHGQPHR